MNSRRDICGSDLIRLFSNQRGPVAQLDRALRFERRGWEFKSLRVHHSQTNSVFCSDVASLPPSFKFLSIGRTVAALSYNASVKNWDAIIVGGGIIGLSLSIALHKRGLRVLVVERGEPGREASHAAAGMLADCPLETPAALQALATASARMYPEFVLELQDESGIKVDLRDQGTLLFAPEHSAFVAQNPLPASLAELEPAMSGVKGPVAYLKERSVDPRALVAAALKAAKHRGVDISSGTIAMDLLLSDGRVAGIQTDRTHYGAPCVVNCAGAWAGSFSTHHFPTRPVKGQMLAVASAQHDLVRHVIRAPEVYLVPRSDGRIVIGSTLEETGFDKRTDADTIQRLHQAAIRLVPALEEARILEDWAGLRPGTPDDLPILGATSTPGYFVTTGHFRDGILLTPVTAHVMAQVITGEKPDHELSAFSPQRFLEDRACL
jgi:glycine oxidase